MAFLPLFLFPDACPYARHPGRSACSAQPAPHSLVLLRPVGLLVRALLLLGIILLIINTWRLAAGYWPGRKGAGALLGLGLVLGAGYRAARGNQPRLLTIGRDALQLATLGAKPDQPAETIPVSSITAYTYWLRRCGPGGLRSTTCAWSWLIAGCCTWPTAPPTPCASIC